MSVSVVIEIRDYRQALRSIMIQNPDFPKRLPKNAKPEVFKTAFTFDRCGTILSPTRIEHRNFGTGWKTIEHNYILFLHPDVEKYGQTLSLDLPPEEIEDRLSQFWRQYVKDNGGLSEVIDDTVFCRRIGIETTSEDF